MACDFAPVLGYGGRVKRTRRALPLLVGALLVCQRASADVDGQVFTSTTDRIRLTIPKGWRASDLPSYPGALVYLLRSQPEGRIVVGAEPLREQLVCGWPQKCRAEPSLAKQYACALVVQLDRNHNVGSINSGPKENAQAGLPSVWFEASDNRRFVRLAVAVNERRAVTLVLSTQSAADRAAHSRAFDQTLRSLQELSEAEAAPASTAPAAGEAAAAAPSEEEPTGSTRLALPLFDPIKGCPPSAR